MLVGWSSSLALVSALPDPRLEAQWLVRLDFFGEDDRTPPLELLAFEWEGREVMDWGLDWCACAWTAVWGEGEVEEWMRWCWPSALEGGVAEVREGAWAFDLSWEGTAEDLRK